MKIIQKLLSDLEQMYGRWEIYNLKDSNSNIDPPIFWTKNRGRKFLRHAINDEGASFAVRRYAKNCIVRHRKFPGFWYFP